MKEGPTKELLKNAFDVAAAADRDRVAAAAAVVTDCRRAAAKRRRAAAADRRRTAAATSKAFFRSSLVGPSFTISNAKRPS